jgi:hypothetical protein
MAFLPYDVRTIILPETGSAIEVDATPTQDHDLQNAITEFPLEDGAKAGDHITRQPNQVELEAVFSDTPISKFNPLAQLGSSEGRSREFFRKMQDIKNNAVKCILVTGLQSYRNMYVLKISVPRRSGEGKMVRCMTTFKEIIINTRAGTGRQGVTTPVTADVEHTARGLIEIGDLS